MVKLIKPIIEHLDSLESLEAKTEFLKGILTPGEIEEISQRFEIVKMLKAEIPQREIAERLGVGIATVTRGSREIKLGRFKHVKPDKDDVTN